METIQIPKKNAIAAYKVADKPLKKVLEELLGKENLLLGKITDQVKTFDEAYDIFMEYDFTDELYRVLQVREKKELTCIDKLIIVARVLQEDWRPDYSNGDQRKWFPYFEYKKSGFGFSDTYYDFTLTYARCGSRLCLPTSELAEYFGKQFLSLFNEFLLTQ